MKIDKSEFHIQHNTNQSVGEVRLYTNKSSQDYIDEVGYYRLSTEGEKLYAKAVKNKQSKSLTNKSPLGFTYYVKADPNKNLYDPTDLHSIEPKIKKSFLNKICKTELRLLEVSESIFNKYITFLKTENAQWLVDAQREVK